MQEDADVSIVIPARNAERHLQETLASLQRQSYPPQLLEVIAVNDGSDDGTAELLRHAEQHTACRFRTLTLERAVGVSAARNLGFQQSTAPWVLFLDADDLLPPKAVAQRMECASAAGESVGAVYCNYQTLELRDGAWVPGGLRVPSVDSDPQALLLRTEHFIQLGATLLRREAVQEAGGFNPALRLIEDVDLLLRVALRGWQFRKIAAVEPGLLFRQAAPGIVKYEPRDFIEACVRNARMMQDAWEERGELEANRRASITTVYYNAARYYADWDRNRLRQLCADLERLERGFVPPGSKWVRLLSRMIGFYRTQLIVGALRPLMSRWRGRLPVSADTSAGGAR